MTKLLEYAIEKVRTLPETEQDTAAELLLVVVERYGEPEQLDDETRTAIEEGLAQLARGEKITQEEMEEFYRQRGA